MTLPRAVVLLFTAFALLHRARAEQQTGAELVDGRMDGGVSQVEDYPGNSSIFDSPGHHLFTAPYLTCSLFPNTPQTLAQDLWEVKLTPLKGRGVFARRSIPKGTHILTESPLFVIHPPEFIPGRGFEMVAMVADVEAAFGKLSPDEKEMYLSCHEERLDGDDDGAGTSKLLAIFRSNAYTMGGGGGGSALVGIYPQVALINHSCQPNVLNADREGTRVIVATRDIGKGEEILTTYIPLLMDTASRNHRLSQYGFQCTCPACQSRASDAQRVQAGSALHQLESDTMSSAEEEEEDSRHQQQAETLATYVEDEGFADYLVKTSRLALHYAARAQNVSSARRWAEKHLRHHEVVDRDSVEARMARELLESMYYSARKGK